jgi:hypothetical protein
MSNQGTIILYNGFNQSAPGANTDIISGGLVIGGATGVQGICALAVTVTLATASVFNYTRTRGGTTFTIGIYQSVALASGDGYGPFLIPVAPGDTINFQVETDGVIRQLLVEGVFSEVR